MGLTDLFYPKKCVLCEEMLEKGAFEFCHTCRSSWPELGRSSRKVPHTDRWAAVWKYEGHVRDSLIRYKFANRQSYAVPYGRMMALTVQRELDEPFDYIAYVPISAQRKRHRGYDQVELLAEVISKELRLPYRRVLTKIRHNDPQSGIEDAAMRRANVLNAYRVTKPEEVAGKHILLLDDIITTGATIGECARMLRLAGAETICGLSVAAKE